MTKTALISFLNILFGFSLQLLFLYFITPSSLIDEYIAQVSIPFLFTGLTLVSFREDFFSNLLVENNKIIMNQSIIFFIILSSLVCFVLMHLQGWKILTCIIGVIYYCISCCLAMIATSIKKFVSDFIALLPQSITYIATLIIFLIFISMDFIPSILMVSTIASFSCLTIFSIYLLYKTSFQLGLSLNRYAYQIKIDNILHNLIFVIPTALEAYFISFLNESDITHLAFVHRIYIAITGVGVFIIFYKLDSIQAITNKFFTIKKLVFIILAIISVLFFHILLLKYQLFEDVFNIINLDDDRLILISSYFFLAYGINLFVYYLFRTKSVILFRFNEILFILIIFILINSYGLAHGTNLVIYLISFLASWVFVVFCALIKIHREKA